MATLIILNYASGLVYIDENYTNDKQIEEVEEYIATELGISLKNVNYMVTEQENPIEYI